MSDMNVFENFNNYRIGLAQNRILGLGFLMFSCEDKFILCLHTKDKFDHSRKTKECVSKAYLFCESPIFL